MKRLNSYKKIDYWSIADSLVELDDNWHISGIGMDNWRLVYGLLQNEYNWYVIERLEENEDE